MMTVKKFTTQPRTDDPVEFAIDGTTFRCLQFVPGSVIVEHTSRLAHPNEAIAAREILELWKSLMSPEEHARFREFIDDPDRQVDLQLLGEVLAWAIEEFGGRPTRRPSASQPGPSTKDRTSSPSPAVTG